MEDQFHVGYTIANSGIVLSGIRGHRSDSNDTRGRRGTCSFTFGNKRRTTMRVSGQTRSAGKCYTLGESPLRFTVSLNADKLRRKSGGGH